VPAPGQVDELPVGVELGLLGRIVAEPYRARPPVPLEPFDHVAAQTSLAGYPVDDLQILRMAGGRAHDERAERVGPFDGAELGQRAEAEARVANPGVTVVPIPRSARCLGQRRRRSSHDRPGRGVRQRFEHDPRAPRGGLVPSVQPQRPGPFPPPVHRALEQLVDGPRIGLIRRARVHALRGTVGEREAHTIPRTDRESADQLVLGILGELLLAPHEQRIVASARALEAVPVATDPRPNLAVVEPGREPHLELERPAHPFDHAQDLPGVGAERGVADQKAVEQPRPPRGTDELGLEHERVVEVGAHVLERAVPGRIDRAMPAASPVEQAAERAPGVESREAAPIDRAVSRHERRGVAVADQRVVGDLRVVVGVGHGRCLPRTGSAPSRRRRIAEARGAPRGAQGRGAPRGAQGRGQGRACP